MQILNLTQHPATTEQKAAGVVDVPEDQRKELIALLTFDNRPRVAEIAERAEAIARLAVNLIDSENGPITMLGGAMIGGAPFLMVLLERALWRRGIAPCYAFSRRESVEEIQPDGSVRKINVFRHAGFVNSIGP